MEKLEELAPRIAERFGSVQNALMVSSDDSKEMVLRLLAEPNLNFYELAIGLAKLHDETSSAVAELISEIGNSRLRRRLYYLLDVGRLIKEFALSKQEAESVGWTKLQIIARHQQSVGPTTKKQRSNWIELAKSVRVRALRQALNGNTAQSTRAVVFHLSEDERHRLRLALLKFGASSARRGLVDKEIALMAMVSAINPNKLA